MVATAFLGGDVDLLSDAPIACHEIDASGTITMANEAECILLGLPEHEVIGRNILEFVVAEDREESREAIRRKMAGEIALRPFERRYERPDGARLVLEIHETAIRDAAGKTVGLRSFLFDITQRRRTEEQLQDSERRYRHLVECASDIIYRADLGGHFVFFNSVATRMLGYEPQELLGRRYVDLIREDCRKKAQSFYRAQLAHRIPNTYFEFPVVAKNGQEFWLGQNVMLTEENDRPVAFEAVARNITEQRRASEELARIRDELELRVRERTAELALMNDFLRKEIEERRQAEEERRKLEAQVEHRQRLESLGVLAGGIAHDFNNLLATIMGYASMATVDLPEGDRARDCMEEVVRAARAGADLTQQMLAYAGRGKFVLEPLDVSVLVADLLRLLGTLISKKATLRPQLAEKLPAVRGDRGQMRQIVLNLVTNASDALGGGSGVIEIRTAAIDLTEGDVKGLEPGSILPPGPYVLLEVIDAGCGMDEATLSRIFDPFFTTKFTGRGLGLAAVLGIVRGHGGSIVVESEPDCGTRFRVYLPACEEPAQEPVPAPRKSDPNWRGKGLVLVVDDEPAVRDLASEILSRAGFNVITASDGHEAVVRFAEHADSVRAVVLDMTMPGMDGGEVYRELARRNPAVRVVVCSGYEAHEVNEQLDGETPPLFLAKPYLPSQLLSRVREAIER